MHDRPRGSSTAAHTAADTTTDAAADIDGIVELRRGINRMQRMLGSRRIQARLREAAAIDLTQQGVAVLRVVGDGVPRTVADIAAEAHLDVAAVSRQLRSLEDQAMLTRSASPDHGSVVIVEATDEGRAAAARVETVQRQHFAEALDAWTDEQCGELGRLLGRLVDDLQRTPYREA